MICVAGPNLPHEVLYAAGLHGGALPIDPYMEAPRAREWVESKFMPFAFPLVEAWAHGQYDDLDMVLFSRADDSSQRLYYYINELQRRGLIGGPEAAILDISKIPREASLIHMTHNLRLLVERLGVDEAALEQAIAETNVKRGAGAKPLQPACLIWGSSAPDASLTGAVKGAGFQPVGQTLAEEWMDLGEAVAEQSGDPIRALAEQLHGSTTGSRSFADPVKSLHQAIEQCEAKAVVLWRIEEDEARCWHLQHERKYLDSLEIPSLILTRRDWLCQDGVTDEISAFLAEHAS